MIYSKTLNTDDYGPLKSVIDHIISVRDTLNSGGAFARFEHQHRAWEYGLITHALIHNNISTVLDVGGGGSVFAPAYTSYPITIDSGARIVTQVDPGIEVHWIQKQSEIIGHSLEYIPVDFLNFDSSNTYDAVISLSTIEHVSEDTKFFTKLLDFANIGGLVAITFDYYPTGEQRCGGHIRTYSEATLVELIDIGKDKGFELLENQMDYTYHGDDVNNYTFGSLVLKQVHNE